MLQTTRLVLAIGLFLKSAFFLSWSCIVFATFSEFSRSVLCWSQAGCDLLLAYFFVLWLVLFNWAKMGCEYQVTLTLGEHSGLNFKDSVFRQLTNLNRRYDKGHKILFFLELVFLPFTVTLYFSTRKFLVALKVGFLRFLSPFFPFFKLVMVWSLTTMYIDPLELI